MSTLAEITVKQCDCCGHTLVLANPHQWDTFRVLWYDGYRVDFCNACKLQPRNLLSIGEDLAERKRAIETVAAAAKRVTEVEHVN